MIWSFLSTFQKCVNFFTFILAIINVNLSEIQSDWIVSNAVKISKRYFQIIMTMLNFKYKFP